MIDPRTPCIIGVAQRTVRPEEGDAPEPLELWEGVSRGAAADSGGRNVLASVDSLQLVYGLSWQYDDPPGRLAARLGLSEGERYYSGLSGTTPQQLIQKAATAILRGEREAALVVGGEALATKRRARREGRKLAWSFPPAERPVMPFDDPFHPAEVAHEVFQAYLTFAIFDVARRAHLGLSPEENRRQLGELFAPMTAVAAANPYAWFRIERSPEELIEVTPENRMVAYPYTKNLVSIMDVDMAAAILVTSDERAEALGVPRERRVYLRGWGYARDPVYVAEREDLWRSCAMEAASHEALARAGVGIDEVAHLDLYSCFPSSVNFARDALGIRDGDPRPLTVTGGLPYHGGAGNNYLSHSVATLVQKLREAPTDLGMVSGVGMHMTNHVFAVYSATPGPVEPPDLAAVQERVDRPGRRSIRNPAPGPAEVAAYSVVHDRSGPVWGVCVCELPDGARAYARVEDRALLEAMEREEWVGRAVELVEGGKDRNLIKA
ncbi:MAG: acetyl-CoA acetyltransferase [Myxococcota bacterium]